MLNCNLNNDCPVDISAKYPTMKELFRLCINYSKPKFNKYDRNNSINNNSNNNDNIKSKRNILNIIRILFPISQWIGYYNKNWFKRDILAGVTVSILLIPQALAYAVLAGLPEVWGLYASAIPIFIYSIFGTSSIACIGPVAPTAIMVSNAVSNLIPDNLDENSQEYMDEYFSITVTVTLLAGIALTILGILKVGGIVQLLSKPVMTGFIMSAACIIFANQLKGLLGLEMGRYSSFILTIVNVFINIHTINWWTTLVSILSLILLLLPKIPATKKHIPRWFPLALVVIVSVTILSYVFKFEKLGIKVVGGNIKSGFPTPTLPDMKYITKGIPGAFIVALVSYMGSIALEKGFDQKISEKLKAEKDSYHDSLENSDEADKLMIPKPLEPVPITLDANKEFIAYGITNIIGSFFSSFVVSGSFGRTALNYDMEGHSQVSGIIQGVFSTLALLFLMPLLSPLPKCVLAALVTAAIYGLIRNGIMEAIFLWNISRIELVCFSISFLIPLFIGLELGIVISMGASILLNVYRISNTNVTELGQIISPNNTPHYLPLNHFSYLKPKRLPNMKLFELQAQLSWTNSSILTHKIKDTVSHDIKYIILCMSRTQFIDSTALRDLITTSKDLKNAIIFMTCIREPLKMIVDRYRLNYDGCYPENLKMRLTIHDCVLYCQNEMNPVSS